MSILRLNIILALLMLLAVFLGVASFKIWYRRFQASSDIGGLEQNIQKRESAIGDLESKLRAAQDPAAAEQEAKVRLHRRRPEERIVFLVPQDGDAAPRNQQDAPQAAEFSGTEKRGFLENPKRWWQYFYGDSMRK